MSKTAIFPKNYFRCANRSHGVIVKDWCRVRAHDKYRDAANAMDNYQSRLSSARNAASRSEDYLRKAAGALR